MDEERELADKLQIKREVFKLEGKAQRDSWQRITEGFIKLSQVEEGQSGVSPPLKIHAKCSSSILHILSL